MIRWRQLLVLVIVFLFFVSMIGRLFFLQIINFDFYNALASGQQKLLDEEKGKRGEIFSSQADYLAMNIKKDYLFISPAEIKEKEKTASILSQLLSLDYEMVLEKTQKSNYFEVIKKEISEEEKNKIEEAIQKENLEGVYIREEIKRYYPQQDSLAHVLGFVNADGEGGYGIEGYYDDLLKGETKIKTVEKSLFGYLSDFSPEEQTKLFLTIDLNIQFKAENELEKAAEKLQFKQGEILVMDPLSGKILALAQYPSFNPNYYFQTKDQSLFLNGLTQKVFEPGSVFKPITMAAAINEGKITPQTKYVDTGEVKIGGWIIRNYDNRVWGERTMTEVLERSINTGAVFVQQKLGNEAFLDYLQRFGFFEKTGIDLQGEVFSENKEFKKGYEINFATASFGQGIQITGIQLARAYAAIANGGKLVRPYLLEKYEKNPSVVEIKPEIQREGIISPETALQVKAMLVSVIENGFGKKAKIEGYYLAGKTGTALIAWSSLGINRRGYSDQTWQTFIGFGPAFHPRFLILVKLENPKTKTAEYSALPIFRNLAEYIINYWEIPPDYEVEE